MLIANAPCSWGVAYPTGNAVTSQHYLDEVAEAGYRGTELGPFGFLPKDPAVLQDELARRDLVMIGATHVHTLGDAASGPVLMQTLGELAPLLVSLGARHLVIMDESNFYPRGQEGVLDAAGWAGLTRMVRDAQALVEGEHGLKLSFHPHIGTAVERESQIDRLLDETDIGLCFDTGHHAFWDQDPLTYMERVFPRIAYMHLKNVDGAVRQRVLDGQLSIAESYGAGVMCPLPDGVVDIRAVMQLLVDRGFAGPIVVEQDVAKNAAETPLQLAARNLAYMQVIAG
ncbi:MAG: sugar phosphate isomerase/epimerase [Alphaproteobacteria bacterium]|nr:sugar phosphate isomerase/epimerase [Alphaproteobacteria bacterium]MBU1563081.1 sugar phosphate isomerase/epimerase [Alphaproteobacteria bacterium]MBU2304276.1 sugar phosphate isomerase/epimerase [Alphaproteobacteria bacterium]MBU2368277.1 sugar phosphate isomerase/epimerase [Alphaproteobacteria bacterium]